MDTRSWYTLLYVSSLSLTAVVLALFYLSLSVVESLAEPAYCGTVGPIAYPVYGSEEEGYGNGKELFKNLCAQCHAKDMTSKATGPALAGVEDRWAAYPREDLYDYIRNSQATIVAGQPRAVAIWEAYKPIVMSNFPALADHDIEEILVYVRVQAAHHGYRSAFVEVE